MNDQESRCTNSRRSRLMGGVLGLLVIFAIGISAGSSDAGMSFGVRAGYADFNGDVFEDSGDLGNIRLLGAQAAFPVAGRLELEIAGEAATEDLESFDIRDVDDAVIEGNAKWDDFAVYSSLRLHVLPLAGFFGIYLGGGIGVHFSEVMINSFGDITDEAQQLIDDIEDEKERFEWHGLVGVSFRLEAIPIDLFGEGRYRDITGDDGPEATAVYAGVNLRL